MKHSRSKEEHNKPKVSKQIKEQISIPSRTNQEIVVKREQNAEILASILIRKMINIAVNKANTKQIERKIGDICFNRAQIMWNSITQLIFIEHDNDDCNDWLSIIEPTKPLIERGIPNKLTIMKESPKQNKSNTNNNNQETLSLFSRSTNKDFTRSSNKMVTFRSSGLIIPKEKNHKPIDLANGDIKMTNQHLKESDDIISLRRDILVEMNSKKEEERKKKKDKQKRLEELALVKNVTSKPFHSDTFTFDTDGNLLLLKKVNIDTFSNDFCCLNYCVKDLKNNSYNQQATKPRTIITQEDKQLTKDHLPFITNRENEYRNRVQSINSKAQKYCSGNNYDIMTPTTGVIIKGELNKSKSGDMNFKNKYNKYSIQDYQKMITENSSNVVAQGISQSARAIEKQSYDTTEPNNKETKTQKITNNQLSIQTTKSSGFLLNSKKTASHFLSESNAIKLKSNAILSLRDSLSTLDDNIIDFNHKLKDKIQKNQLHRETFFNTGHNSLITSTYTSRKISKDKELLNKDFNDINQFNKQLLNQKTWGLNNQGYKSLLKEANIKYPTKKKFTNEIDSKIKELKMPRERRFHKSISNSYFFN